MLLTGDIFPSIAFWCDDTKTVSNLMKTCREVRSHLTFKDLCHAKARKLIAKYGINSALPYAPNAEVTKILLKYGADIHADEDAALLSACECGHLDVVTLLLELGADVNVVDHDDYTPLQQACFYEHPEIVKVLVENGADVNEMNGKPMEKACHVHSFEIVRLLHSLGAKLTAEAFYELLQCDSICWEDKDESDIIDDYLEIARYFLKHGFDIHSDDDIALKHAVEGAGSKRMLDFLIENGANIHSGGGNSASISTAQIGESKILRYLLNLGFDIHAEDDLALRLAVNYGNYDNAKILLQHGADVHARYDGALLIACDKGRFSLVQLLLEFGANVHEVDDDEEGFLSVASRNGHLKIVELLLQNGANVFEGCGNPLDYAISNNYIEIVKLLIDHGADVNNCDYGTKKVIERKDTDMVKLLISKGASFDGVLGDIYQKGQKEYIDFLLTNGAKGRDLTHNLHNTVIYKHFDLLKYMVANGAELNNKEGEYAIWSALQAQNLYHSEYMDQLEFILEHGARIAEESLASIMRFSRPEAIDLLRTYKIEVPQNV